MKKYILLMIALLGTSAPTQALSPSTVDNIHAASVGLFCAGFLGAEVNLFAIEVYAMLNDFDKVKKHTDNARLSILFMILSCSALLIAETSQA